jgi:hypothetical protein
MPVDVLTQNVGDYLAGNSSMRAAVKLDGCDFSATAASQQPARDYATRKLPTSNPSGGLTVSRTWRS